MVQVKINETKKIEQLRISRNGIDYVADFIDGRLQGASREGDYTPISQDDYDWWHSVLKVHQHIDDVCQAMIGELPDDVRDSVNKDICDMVGNNDLDLFNLPKKFDEWASSLLGEHGYTMTIYPDSSIGFDTIEIK